MKEDIEKTRKVGMNEHLNKPIDIEKLLLTLKKYLKHTNKEDTKHFHINNNSSQKWSHLDYSLGLIRLNHNEKLYKKILQNFVDDFAMLNLHIINEVSGYLMEKEIIHIL